MAGEKFNRLTVISRYYKEGNKKTLWLCKCDCGNEVIAEGYQIRKGYTKSCGCYVKEKFLKATTTHHKRHTRLYGVYTAMKSRCNNPNNQAYNLYGGRGIKVCSEWEADFQTFYDWSLENGYKKGLTLDRIDNDKGYSPDNCRWATMEKQQNNRGNNKYIEIDGEVKTVSQFAKELNVPYGYLYSRYCRDYKKERERAKALNDNQRCD